ncbi:putative ccch zinc finger and rrm domain-containing protein [Diaporthe ampelina]|uniref:Putative ccch zinc finger and rrm domain-containing protein n=1 Tax=Diaporthe ampelina TaxID=1214573 RepID=A0A0G2FWD1_9PEZI|nr:putative ccch zinc finger and rrm domain-containing protein [Diaporthe ampelina]
MTKVVVESIPEENFQEDQVRSFFAQFGNVEEVTMMGYKRLAIVKFDKWSSANAAYKSPKVIFDNRFVKVYWYKEEKHGDVANGGNGANGFKNGHQGNGVKREDSTDIKTEEIDMEEFTRKQEEAQKLHEEKMAKIREIEKQREELEKRQKELQAKQAAEKQRLLEKLAGSRKNSIEPGGGEAAATGEKGGEASKTEALKATLAKLRGEAAAMGIDPNGEPQDDDASMSTPYHPSYGRGGRGGYYRGRGAYVPRGAFRGGGRGGGRGNFHAAYAAFSLDNRPKTVAISGADFSAPEKDEALRRHLFSFGEGVTEIQTTPSVTHLSFSDRKQAEAFYSGFKNGKIPGINDDDAAPVEVSWVAGPVVALPGSTTSSVNPGGGGDGLDSAMADADSGDTDHRHDGGGGDGKADPDDAGDGAQGQSQGHQHQHQEPGEAKTEVDYDVAGENEWDE